MLTDYISFYEKLAKELSCQPWFERGWKIDAGVYPRNAIQPKSVGLQLFRNSWFNDSGRGIHFESWMTNADVKRGTASVVLHVESSKERTGINGKKFVETLLKGSERRIRSWDGYEIKPNYTMQPFCHRVAITPESFVSRLRAEFSRLAQELGDEIDKSILIAQQ